MRGVLAAWLLLALHVQSGASCPAAVEVERQLAPLLGEGVAARDQATVTPVADGSVSLSLVDPNGQPIGARTLPAARTCDAQAKAVAVTLAVWEAQLHPEISLALDRLASPEPPLIPRDTAVARVEPAAPPAWELALGAAVVGDVQSSAWAPGARLEGGLGRAGGRWRGRLAVTGMAHHQIDLPPGTVSWSRAFLHVGAEIDVARGHRWAVALGAGAVGGVASIAGTGFAVDRSTRSLELGGEGRLRAEARLGRRGQIRPWLAGGVAVWARRQALDIQGTDSTAALPRVEPLGALGADFVW